MSSPLFLRKLSFFSSMRLTNEYHASLAQFAAASSPGFPGARQRVCPVTSIRGMTIEVDRPAATVTAAARSPLPRPNPRR